MGEGEVMEIVLRDYQQTCIEKVIQAYQENKQGRSLLVLPTGSGKTIVFSQIIHKLNVNTIILAHRDELLNQAADKYRMVKPDAIIGKVGSGFHEYGGELTVASVATVSRPEHLKRLKAIGYGLIVVDETHHLMADGYQKVLEALPDAFVLGVTATPDRLDKKSIEDILGKPVYEASIIDMIRDGYLCDVKAVAIKTETDLSDLHTEMGDYKVSELETAVDTPERNKRIVDAYVEHAENRRAATFCVTVAHAENLASTFSLAGVPAGVICGETPLDERKQIYKAFYSGEIKVLTTVNVLSEGWDEPLCDCIIMARPTQSRGLFVQAIGRGLRLAPAKQNCIILDITDNCLKHRLEPQNLRSALNKNIKNDELVTEALAREEQEANERKSVVRKLPETRDKDLTVNILEKLEWYLRGDNGTYVLEVGPQKHRIALVPCHEAGSDLWGGVAYYSVWAKLAPDFKAQQWAGPQPLDWAQSQAEKKARMLLSDASAVKLVDRNASWRSQPATEKQLEQLAKWQARFHLNYDPETITKGQAGDLLDPIYSKFEASRKAREVKGQVAV